jgi:hypothetical protein
MTITFEAKSHRAFGLDVALQPLALLARFKMATFETSFEASHPMAKRSLFETPTPSGGLAGI